MGYYTHHALVVINGIEDDDFYTDEIRDLAGHFDLFMDSHKWYEMEEQMAEYSKTHPTVTFMIEGAGDDMDDRWRTYWKNGKCYTVTPVWPEYQPHLLED